MGCVIITPLLKEIANQLNIPPARVSLLAGLSAKNDNWTREDILAELAKLEATDKSAKYQCMRDGVLYNEPLSDSQSLLFSDKLGIHINIPSNNSVLETISFLQGNSIRENSEKELFQTVNKLLGQEFWRNLSILLSSTDKPKVACNLFMNYYAMHRIAYNYNFDNRTPELKQLIIKRAIEDSTKLFLGCVEYLNPDKPKMSQQAAANDKLANLSEEQKKQFSALFGPYDEGGGADINELFTEPLPKDVDMAITAFNWENKVPLRSHMVWIVQHLKPEYRKYLSSFYNQKPQGSMDSVTKKHQGNWTRQEAQNNPKILYVFTDNTDRDSGSGIIPTNSWYSQKYGEGHHFPTMTAAVVRGLDNARPISTQRWFHQGAKGATGNWTDTDVEEFTKVIEDELKEIVNEFNTGKYDTIMFPDGDGLFNTKISNITKQRTPKLYSALSSLLDKYGFNSLIPKEASNTIQGTESENMTAEEMAKNAFKGFTRTQTTEQTQTIETPKETYHIEIPKVSRNYLNISNREDNPLTQFNRTFNSFEKNEAVDAVTQDFIDIVTDETNSTDTDIRRAYIKANIPHIIDRLRQDYRSYLEDTESQEEDKDDYGESFVSNKITYINKILSDRNLEILLKDASMGIERAESIAIDFSQKKGTDSQQEDTQIDNNTDPEDEGKDGWMIRVREVDPRNTLSTRVKKIIASTPRGINEVNVMGKPKMLSPDFVHAVLMNELSNLAYVEDFVNGDNQLGILATEKFKTKYSWIKSIVRKLQADPVLISQFFTDFRRDFILYTQVMDVEEEVTQDLLDSKGNKILDSDGKPIKETITKRKRVTKYLNQAVALDSTIQELINNYDNGEKLDKDSIYTEGKVLEDKRVLNSNKLKSIIKSINDYDFSWDDKNERAKVFNNLLSILHAIGINTQLNDLESLYNDPNFYDELRVVLEGIGTILDTPIPEGSHLIDYFNGAYTNIAEVIGKVSEVMNVMSFRSVDKMYYSYSAPNYINTEIKRLKDTDEKRRNKYISEQFKKYPWFYDKDNNRWRNYWMELLESNPYVREHLQLDNMNTISRTEDEEVEAIPYTNWDEDMMAEAFLLEYYSIPKDAKSSISLARYNTPIYSDSPMVNFITMPRFDGSNFRDEILEKLIDVAEQELLRIRDVDSRKNLDGGSKIANYDKSGNKFLFFPRLNELVNYNELNEYYKKGNVELARGILSQALYQIMTEGAADYRNNTAIGTQTMIDNGIINDSSEKDEALDNYYWNQAYATTQIIQLTTTDLAYYKNGVDFQKRYKEVYAAGNKLNTHSKYGKQFERAAYLSDVVLPSNSLFDIEEVLNQAVEERRITALDRKAILNKFDYDGGKTKGKTGVNVADAQAYRTIYSMRSVLDMIGQWTPDMERAINKFEDGTWTIADFSLVWQTIKPFMFTQIDDTTPGFFSDRKVPHQNKNSEFLLLAMHSLIAQHNIGKSPQLRALNKWMVDNDIDVVMFESAVKSGGQGVIDISKAKTYDEVYSTLEKVKNSPTVIKEFDYEDYVIQQPTPEHLIDHVGIYGSQFRNLIVSDLSDDATFTIDGINHPISKRELLDLYQGAIVENLLEDYEKVKGRFSSIQELQKALLDSIKDNPKYGSDLVDALQIVNGKFNIPLYNPSTTEKVQEVINSFFKNLITKQKIKGGNAILVSDFGFVDDLHCVYGTDHNGKKHLIGVECYMPAYAKDFYKIFSKTDENGNEYLDIEQMKKECPDLLKAIGYRIPTEGKYSMCPLIIKGFLPQANGSAIMLPADITVHAGSDFDVRHLLMSK